MEATQKPFDFEASLARLDGILALPAGSFEEVDTLPPRDKLTFSNGYYANCLAIFVDIRRSSDLPNKYKRPALARIYRAFISEMVAVMHSHSKVREVTIVGDCVWSVANSPLKIDVDEMFSIAAQARTMVRILNHKLTKKGYETPLAVGIGIDYGRALMIKAGYFGSGVNDIVYMGDVVNQASHLASKGDSGAFFGRPICLSGNVFSNLNDHNKSLCTVDYSRGCYTSDAVSVAMNDWLTSQT